MKLHLQAKKNEVVISIPSSPMNIQLHVKVQMAKPNFRIELYQNTNGKIK
jgi:hypothetical protein